MGKIYHVDLTDTERVKLEDIVKRRVVRSEHSKRSRILLAADHRGDKVWKDEEISQNYQVSVRTVERLRKRFVEDGLDIALKGKPRLNLDKKKFDGAVEANLVALRCSEPDLGRDSWTLELLADKMVALNYVESISIESVRQILKKNEIKPWRVAEWVIPEASAEFVCSMEDVLDVYARPYDEQYPVVCFDESPKQLISELRQSYTDKHGVLHQDYEYKREGAAEIFMITQPLGGRREVFVEDDHKGVTWAKTRGYIAEEMFPTATKITVVMDNLSSHKKHNLYQVYEPQRARVIINKLEFIYTPKHGSWLNIAECELSVLSKQALNKRFDSKEKLTEQVNEWAKQRNIKQKGVDWQFSTPDARIKLKRLYPRVLT